MVRRARTTSAAPDPHGERLRALARAVLGDGPGVSADVEAVLAGVTIPGRRSPRLGERAIRAHRSVFVASVERLQQRLRAGRPVQVAAGLPLAERLVALLVDGHGFGVAAAARVLGVAEVTAAARLERARAMLAAAPAHSRTG